MCCSMSLEIYVLQYDSLYAMGLSPMGLLWKVHVCVCLGIHVFQYDSFDSLEIHVLQYESRNICVAV